MISWGTRQATGVLREAAEKLRKIFGSSGILGRLGGDEFVALIRDPMTREDMERQMGAFERGDERYPSPQRSCHMQHGRNPCGRGSCHLTICTGRRIACSMRRSRRERINLYLVEKKILVDFNILTCYNFP